MICIMRLILLIVNSRFQVRVELRLCASASVTRQLSMSLSSLNLLLHVNFAMLKEQQTLIFRCHHGIFSKNYSARST